MKSHRSLFLIFPLLCLLAAPVTAEVKLPSVFSDHMVLQRGQQVPVWGTDTPGTEVTVTLGDASGKAKADGQGRFTVELSSLKAGGPFTLKVAGSSTKSFKDVLVGEVWLCSGQSNMEWSVSRSKNPQEEISAANYPKIRHIKIPHTPAATPQDDVSTSGWQVCSPKTVANFTAVGYYFGRELHKELDGVPIGLLGSNWGGTRIEPWTPPVGFKKVPALKSIVDNLPNLPQKAKNGRVNHQSATALYNGMIQPLVPYGIRGAIWYQGESNVRDGMAYYEKMKALIYGWRALWKNEDLPFYFVQLAPYKYGGDPTMLAKIWEAQTKTLSVPHTGMAVITDIGNTGDIHPKNKQDVGKRLALWALAKTYGKEDVVYSGPLYKSMKVEGDKVRISFDHTGGGLVSRDEKPLSWFTIAGKDNKFAKATATIEGDGVLVHSPEVKQPVAVRFGWDRLAEPNLANKAGLPASPFRTDSGK